MFPIETPSISKLRLAPEPVLLPTTPDRAPSARFLASTSPFFCILSLVGNLDPLGGLAAAHAFLPPQWVRAGPFAGAVGQIPAAALLQAVEHLQEALRHGLHALLQLVQGAALRMNGLAGLVALQGAAVSTGIPFTIVVLVMCYCLWLALRSERAKL